MCLKEKFTIQIKHQELIKLLISSQDEVIWKEKTKSNWAIITFLTNLILLILTLIFTPDWVSILTSLFIFLSTISVLYISQTMVYSIFPNRITFEWGLLKNKKVEIPINDILSVNLVQYTDDDRSTIYFHTGSQYKLKKINFDTSESRALITFENIKNGAKVEELLLMLMKQNKQINMS